MPPCMPPTDVPTPNGRACPPPASARPHPQQPVLRHTATPTPTPFAHPQVNPAEEMLARATRCRLSGERLAPPCVADELGSLFNKEALVHALLNKTLPPALAHISSLKAVTTLKLDAIPSRASSHTSAGPGPGSRSNGGNGVSSSCDLAVFQCPVTGLEMNGRFGFVIHKPTGVVLSERALREVRRRQQRVSRLHLLSGIIPGQAVAVVRSQACG